MRVRLAGLLIALLVGACSLPTFNPPKLKTMASPGAPLTGGIEAAVVGR